MTAAGGTENSRTTKRYRVRVRTVLVAGGTGALGSPVVERLRADGWRVVVADRRGDGDTVVVDLFTEEGVRRAVAAAVEDRRRPLRALVNLVGGFAMGGRVHETPVEEFERQFRLNLRPGYLLCQAALPHLIDAGGGSVVCVSSRVALRPFAGAAGYITSKAAVLAFVDALAVEYREFGVRVNAVLPSVIDTPANRASQPTATMVPPEQIAEVISYLCSDASAVTSGAHIPVYGNA
jgi:NAD(P)-dependent dehydrogenase (short-subunit alcohol dehydrogenase family)